MTPTIGILGGGQLARMLALAGHPLGMRFAVLDPARDAPAACVAEHVCADYTDKAALNHFASGVDLITYEFENVPYACIEHLATHLHRPVPIYPPAFALRTGQDRLLEKQLFRSLDIPVAPFADITSLECLREEARAIGLPAILKTRRLGYDGKGQVVLRPSSGSGAAQAAPELLERAWTTLTASSGLHPPPLILEQFIPFSAEASILAVRSRTGEIRTYPLVRNEHSSGILRRSRAPFSAFCADLPAINAEDLEHQAVAAATKILGALDYVGLLAVEFFVKDGVLIANEIAPRVHNSGHWTIEGSVTSQFENHLRAVAGLPLGDTSMRLGGAAAYMVNLVGGWPDPLERDGILAVPSCHLHLYGKSPRPGRKVGHATLVAPPATLAVPAEQLQRLADATWQA